MRVVQPEFDVEITSDDLSAIRAAIRKWGKPADVAEAYFGVSLYEQFCAWDQFVDTDWADWDRSEYDHDIGCRTWIQLAIEFSSPATAERLRAVIAPIDARFMSRMRPAERTSEATPVLRGHPYFWEAHTLHPDL